MCIPCAPLDRQSPQCDDFSPICRDGRNCGACHEHPECSSGACDLMGGQCATPDAILHVELGAPVDAPCTLPAPCGSIQHAIDLGPASPALTFIEVAAGTYLESLQFQSKDIRLIAKGAVTITGATPDQPVIFADGTLAMSGFRVTGGVGAFGNGIEANALVTLVDSVINSNEAGGVRLSSGRLVMRRSVIASNGGDGVLASPGSGGLDLSEHSRIEDNGQAGISGQTGLVTITTSTIRRNLRGGIDLLLDDAFDLEDSMVVDNGRSNGFGGLRLVAPYLQEVTIFASTVAHNRAAAAQPASGIQCTSDNVFSTVRDSIVYDNLGGMAQASGTCAVTESMVGAAGAGVGGVPAFVNQAGGNYHITAASDAIDHGTLIAPNLMPLDIDGDVRKDYFDLGADEYVP